MGGEALPTRGTLRVSPACRRSGPTIRGNPSLIESLTAPEPVLAVRFAGTLTQADVRQYKSRLTRPTGIGPAAVVQHLDLRDAVHIGHSTGGGEATHYVARYGKGRVAKLVLIGAVPPIMVKTPANPGGLPIGVFEGLRQQVAAHHAQFYRDFAGGPFQGSRRAERGTRPPQGSHEEGPAYAARARHFRRGHER